MKYFYILNSNELSYQHKLLKTNLLDVRKALHLDDPEARHMQLSRPVRVYLNVQFLSVLTQQVSEKQHFFNLYLHLYNT